MGRDCRTRVRTVVSVAAGGREERKRETYENPNENRSER